MDILVKLHRYQKVKSNTTMKTSAYNLNFLFVIELFHPSGLQGFVITNS